MQSLQCGPMAKDIPKSRGHGAAVPGAEFIPQLCDLWHLIFPFPCEPIFKVGILCLDWKSLLKSWKLWQQWALFPLTPTAAGGEEGWVLYRMLTPLLGTAQLPCHLPLSEFQHGLWLLLQTPGHYFPQWYKNVSLHILLKSLILKIM